MFSPLPSSLYLIHIKHPHTTRNTLSGGKKNISHVFTAHSSVPSHLWVSPGLIDAHIPVEIRGQPLWLSSRRGNRDTLNPIIILHSQSAPEYPDLLQGKHMHTKIHVHTHTRTFFQGTNTLSSTVPPFNSRLTCASSLALLFFSQRGDTSSPKHERHSPAASRFQWQHLVLVGYL